MTKKKVFATSCGCKNTDKGGNSGIMTGWNCECSTNTGKKFTTMLLSVGEKKG